ncbi:MAG: hypothetical protein FJW35_03765, partial [Acidobacteria bacterium]|nr:hypothetical protein [Acidobacteriota bacterium]
HPHERLHAVFARVYLPAFGEQVFYGKIYRNDNPADLYRHGLYSLSAEGGGPAVEMRFYSFPADRSHPDAHLDPAGLEGLTPDRMISTRGCEVYWDPEGEGFLGRLREGACHRVSKESGQRLVVSGSFRLTEAGISMAESAVDEMGRPVSGRGEEVPFRLQRCRFYTGWSVVQREGTEEYNITRDIALHDQGARVAVRSEKKEYEIELAELVYQSSKIPILKLALYEKGEVQSFAYTWTHPGAERIGINLRWIQAGFTLRKPAPGGDK